MPELVTDPTVHVDHVSIAVPSIEPALAFFARYFPIDVRVQTLPGYSGDFNWCDFFVGAFKIELIEPVGRDGFVNAFLARRGPGLHHWSLETVDLAPRLVRMERDGLRIVDRFESSDGGMTAFISPRSAFGVLVQFWQAQQIVVPQRPAYGVRLLPNGETLRMRVDHVSIAVRDIETSLRFFERYFPFRLRRAPHAGWDGTFVVASFFVNGYKVELIQNAPGREGFVSRFIDRRGEGLHHLSVDVDRLDPYLADLEAAGVRVVDRQDLGAGYRTAFISPRSAFGVLIQLWETPEFLA